MSEKEEKNSPGRILIVDDEPYLITSIRRVLRSSSYEILTAGTGTEALRLLENHLIDVVLLDIRLPDMSGMDVLRHIKQMDPETVVVMMTGFGNIPVAVEAMKEGAFEFLTKPFKNKDLIPLTLEKALEYKRLHESNRQLRGMISGQVEFKNLVAVSAAMQRILRLVERVAQLDTTILITGETGTGKEVIARAIHFSGPRRNQKFIPVDCGAIPPGLIESELFGHVKGAFTGAASNYEGQLKMADGGTVFLDEVGELPLEMQTRLLRFLQDHEVRPVGGSVRSKVNVRVIAATNRDLQKMVAEGRFRQDFFYRINVVNIHIPPLWERKEDIPPLIQFFMKKYSDKLHPGITLSPEAYERFLQYHWPGNVRELENVILQSFSLCSSNVIRPEDLPPVLSAVPPRPTTTVPAEKIPLSLEAYEKLAIERALRQCRGNVIAAARLLNLGKSTLYRKIKELGINLDSF